MAVDRSVIEFARQALEIDPGDLIPLKPPRVGQAPRFIASEAFMGQDLEVLRRRYTLSDMVAFRIPLQIFQGSQSPEDTHFDVFIRKVQSGAGKGSQAFFVRDGISVLEEGHLPGTENLVLVLADDRPIAKFLGDAENPAHTRWNERSEYFRQRGYRYAVSTLRYVKNSAQQLTRLLAQVPVGLQKDLLQDIFFVERITSATRGKGTRPPRPNLPRRPRPYDIAPVSDGFFVSGPSQGADLPEVLNVRVAYRTRSGAGLRYRPLDFDIRSLPSTCDNCHVDVVSGNELLLKPSGEPFRLQMTGFDRNRDLVV